ncbi:MAG TPA: 30S ribosomal protein S1 [Syntrophomonadaceae bacterium]|nr:30S ribosomal protein S1 [Syntrophomonadaceae bacterium]
MEIIIAEYAGFCGGVRRAYNMALQASQEDQSWYTLGPLVHNQAVVQDLRNRSITSVKDLDELDAGGVIIRSHGVRPQVISELNRKKLKFKDATCPLVKRVQELAQLLRGEGYEVVIFGDRDHPEVQGILGWCDNQALVVADINQAREMAAVKKLGVISQTTKNQEHYFEVIKELIHKADEVRSFNTICSASRKRQEAAIKVCRQVDLMIVIGDRTSSNTQTLVQECKNTGVKTILIQDVSDLNTGYLRGAQRVGITAGASTPDWIIKEVVNRMTHYDEGAPQEQNQEVNQDMEQDKVEETAQKTTEEIVQETAKETVQETTEETAQKTVEESNQETVEETAQKTVEESNQETMETFVKLEAEMADLAMPNRGDIVKGTVIQVLDDEVMVDVGGKSEGIIPLRELSNRKDIESADELVEVGQELEVLVLKWDDDGTILLSKKKVDNKKLMDQLEEDFKQGKVLDGTVVESVKGGLLVDVGVIGFLPASHVEDGYVKNLDDYVGKDFQFKIIEYNRHKKRGSQIVLSRKELVAEEKKRLKEQFWENVEEGQTIRGKIKRIVDYGAFIDLGGFEGLLHVSEIDHVRIDHPSSVLTEGEELDVYILALDRERERVSLSRKKLLKSPWEIVLEKYNEGDIIEGKVVRLAPFGAFVEIEPGVDGLVHISQLADYRVEKPEDVVSVGEIIKIKILSIDPERKRIGLSLKEAQEEEEDMEVQEYLEHQDEEEDF